MKIRDNGRILAFGISICLGTSAWGQGTATQPSTAANDPSRAVASSAVIDQSQLVGLPMNGRSYTQLATLGASVAGDSGGGRQSGGNIRGIKVSGGRVEWNSFLLDGTDINDMLNQVPRSAAGGQLGADTLFQVQVLSNNFGAQYGRAGGGVLNAISRSGSNELHGTLFDYFRNSKMDARNFFDGTEKPPFKRNQFGATVLGPVSREKAFFMAGFEVLRNRLTETVLSYVPDAKARVEAIDKIKPYMTLYPNAQVPVLINGVPTGIAENRTGVAQPSNETFLSFRLDHRLGELDAWFARYTISDANTTTLGASPDFPTLTESRQQYLTLTETHFFSTAFINTLRLSYTRPVSRSSAVFNRQVNPALNFVPGASQFGVIEVPGLVPLGPASNLPAAKIMNTYQAADDFILSRGMHTWKWGGIVERFQWNSFDSTNKGAQWTFNSLDSFLNAGPIGGTTELRVALPESSDSYRAYRQTMTGVYLQDELRLHPRFSMNLGLRYEFTTMIHDARGRDAFLKDELRDTQVQSGRFMSRNPSLKSFAPRFGLSWSPWEDSSKLVVRAGFGIYYDHIIGYSADFKRVTAPFFKLAIRNDSKFIASNVFPNALIAARDPAAQVREQVRIYEYNNPKTPTIYRYHLSLEREVLPGLTAEATYVGARGNNLIRSFEANEFPFPVQQADGSLFFPANTPRINPNFTSIERTTTDSQSFYNALLVSVNRRPWHGFSASLSYTFAKSINESNGAAAVERHYALQRLQSRGLDSGEVRHRISVTYFYNLPTVQGSGFGSRILGGWRLGGILGVRTGLPEEPFFRIRYPGYTFLSLRASVAPGRSNNPTEGVSSGCQWVAAGAQLGGPDLYFDPCALVAPPPGIIGNAGRNIIVGPRVVNMDLSLQKSFPLGGERALQFRAEFFNLLNHSNFNPPERDFGASIFQSAVTRNPNAGRLTSTATEARQIQFALRLSF